MQAAQRLDLGLGRRAAAVEGLRARLGGRALEVVVPLRRPVAVGVDAVDVGDRAVAVVVVQVLAPEARGGRGEGVVVAVRVGDRDEPQLVLGEQVLDLVAGRLALVLDDVLEEPALDLGRDPLARVLGGVVDDGRTAAVLLVARVLGDLVGDDVLAQDALADDVGLHDVGVVRRQIGVPLLERDVRRRAGLRARSRREAPWAEDVVAVRRWGERVGRRDGGRALTSQRAHRRALRLEAVGLRGRGRDDPTGLVAREPTLGEVVARAGEVLRVDPAADHVLVERLDELGARRSGGRSGHRRKAHGGDSRVGEPSHVHELPPRGTSRTPSPMSRRPQPMRARSLPTASRR